MLLFTFYRDFFDAPLKQQVRESAEFIESVSKGKKASFFINLYPRYKKVFNYYFSDHWRPRLIPFSRKTPDKIERVLADDCPVILWAPASTRNAVMKQVRRLKLDEDDVQIKKFHKVFVVLEARKDE